MTGRFRPLIRGLSISSKQGKTLWSFWKVSVPSSGDYQFLPFRNHNRRRLYAVSVPSSGDYQFLPIARVVKSIELAFPSPHPGIINFFTLCWKNIYAMKCFRPLIRGLSISSDLTARDPHVQGTFPSPHPGIINFFKAHLFTAEGLSEFPSPHPGIINFFLKDGIRQYMGSTFPSPHPGIINFFGAALPVTSTVTTFPSPHPGIINFF